MDFSSPLGMERRTVEESVYRDAPARIVEGSRTFATDSQDVWDAISSPDRIPQWFLPIRGDLQVGGRYQLEGNASGDILRCEVASAVEISWEFGESTSWVRLTLASLDEGSNLKLEHIMPKDEASEAHWNQFGPGATGIGWDLGYLGLGMYLSSGKAMQQQECLEWMASAPGKQFVQDCATQWSDAHVRSGVPKETADAMALATVKAYTGES